MEKMLLTTKDDVQKAIEYFGKENIEKIKEEINKYPCILIGNYSDDVDFGENYSFTTIIMEDFKKESGEMF